MKPEKKMPDQSQRKRHVAEGDDWDLVELNDGRWQWQVELPSGGVAQWAVDLAVMRNVLDAPTTPTKAKNETKAHLPPAQGGGNGNGNGGRP